MHSYSPIKESLREWIPSSVLRLRQAWLNWQRSRHTTRLTQTLQGHVLYGPFAGMRYPGTGIGSVASPKLLGTYEGELHGVIAGLTDSKFDLLVNVGAGEGYYAVGILMKIPTARCIAFEANEQGHPWIRQMAELNGVADRLEVQGVCTQENLSRAVSGGRRPVVVMDVEGLENVLLNPVACPGLRRAAVLVEVHEFIRRGVTEQIVQWFASTHKIDRIPTAGASSFRLPVVSGFSTRQIRLLADEMRSFAMEWFWMTPNED